MIRFLRQIRRRLLRQRKFPQYLVYAFGEIILVVLGILIALYINGIYTRNQNIKQETNYLRALSIDLTKDMEDLEYWLNKDSVHLESYSQLVRLFMTDSLPYDTTELVDIIHRSSIISYFNPQNTVFEEMKSSGRLGLIRSDSLRFNILGYYTYSNKVVTSQQINNGLILEERYKSIDRYLDMNSIIESKVPEAFQTPLSPLDLSFFDQDPSNPAVEEFAKHISLMKAAVIFNTNWKSGLLKRARTIQSQIEAYLAKQ